MLDAADEVGLPADPEFRAAFVGYLEWGTRLAVHNSQPDADPIRQAPVPHWGWASPRRTMADPIRRPRQLSHPTPSLSLSRS